MKYNTIQCINTLMNAYVMRKIKETCTVQKRTCRLVEPRRNRWHASIVEQVVEQAKAAEEVTLIPIMEATKRTCRVKKQMAVGGEDTLSNISANSANSELSSPSVIVENKDVPSSRVANANGGLPKPPVQTNLQGEGIEFCYKDGEKYIISRTSYENNGKRITLNIIYKYVDTTLCTPKTQLSRLRSGTVYNSQDNIVPQSGL